MAKKRELVVRCGARRKLDGQPCRNPAGFRTDHFGSGRCFLHGGRSTGPRPGSLNGKRNALKHGIFSRAISESEREVWDKIDINSVDDELRILKLQLIRATIAQQRAIEENQFLETEEMIVTSERSEGQEGAPPGQGIIKTTARRKRRSYEDAITKLVAQINNTMKVRQLLMGNENFVGSTSEEAERIQKITNIDLSDFTEAELLVIAGLGFKLTGRK